MRTVTPRLLVPLTLVAALGLSACSDDSNAGPSQTEQSQAGQSQPSDGGDSPSAPSADGAASDEAEEDDAEERSASAAGVDLNAVGEPIATATVPAMVEGDRNATMDVSLLSLERDGDTVIGLFSFTVHGESRDADDLWDYLGGRRWQPFLVDTTNLTRHDVLGNPATAAMTSSLDLSFRPGQTVYGFAAFAAPPADVTEMTVQLVEGAPPATAVELP